MQQRIDTDPFEATQETDEHEQEFIKADLERGMSFPRSKPLVAILGGSFDPITDAHLKAACEIIHSKCADEVWITPCGARPDKPSLKTSALDRLIMCHLAVDTMFGSKFPLAVKDVELPLTQAAPTLHLVREMEARHPDKDFAFVIGTDLVSGLEQWGCAAVPEWGREAIPTEVAGPRLFAECNFIVINRPGYMIPEEYAKRMKKNFHYLSPMAGQTLVTQRLSSSEVRSRIRTPSMRSVPRECSTSFGANEKVAIEDGNFAMVEGLMPPAVLAHIIRNRLYV